MKCHIIICWSREAPSIWQLKKKKLKDGSNVTVVQKHIRHPPSWLASSDMILLEMLLISLMKWLKMDWVHPAALQFRQNSAASTLGSGSGGRVVEPGASHGGVWGAGDTSGEEGGEVAEGAAGEAGGETRRDTAREEARKLVGGAGRAAGEALGRVRRVGLTAGGGAKGIVEGTGGAAEGAEGTVDTAVGRLGETAGGQTRWRAGELTGVAWEEVRGAAGWEGERAEGAGETIGGAGGEPASLRGGSENGGGPWFWARSSAGGGLWLGWLEPEGEEESEHHCQNRSVRAPAVTQKLYIICCYEICWDNTIVFVSYGVCVGENNHKNCDPSVSTRVQRETETTLWRTFRVHLNVTRRRSRSLVCRMDTKCLTQTRPRLRGETSPALSIRTSSTSFFSSTM